MELKSAGIFQPETTPDLSLGITLLDEANKTSNNAAPFAIGAGGDSPAIGSSTIGSTGITIDLRCLKKLSLHEDKSAVTIGAGNTFEDVYKFLEPFHLCVVGARVAQVGVTGFVLGGGISYYSPTMGFSCDTVLEFEIVLADGTVRKANATNISDLWKALKGGGNNFGVVTELTMRTIPLEMLWGGTNINDIEVWSESVDWFHTQVISSSVDKKAACMIMLCNLSENRFLLHSLKYTSPKPNLEFFKIAMDLSSLESTLREDTLTQLTI